MLNASSRFTLTDPLLGTAYGDQSRQIEVNAVLKHLWPRLTESRQQRIETVVSKRTTHVLPVVESLYDRGNISAVMRSAEAFGFLGFHIIETSERFKEANRITRGADKWLVTEKTKTTRAAVDRIRSQGYRIYATHLDASAVPLTEVDLSAPFALVFGNEKDGISAEMQELCDQRVILPMQGFVQSFNISVAAAIAFALVSEKMAQREVLSAASASLSEDEKRILKAHYTLSTLENPIPVLDRLLEQT